MAAHAIARLACALGLGLGLAGCLDVTADVVVTSDTTAKATMTQVMDRSIYDMAQAGSEGGTDFCAGGEVTVGDATVTCVLGAEGAFEDLRLGSDSTMVFTPAGDGLVRVAFPTDGIKGELDADEAMDAETRAMMEGFFAGHSVTLRIGGGEIVDSNMTVASDRHSAEMVIPFLDLINGTADLPEEVFAVVRAP